MIVRVSGGWKAASEGGRTLSKKPKSRQAALAQLYAIESSKVRRGKQTKAGRSSTMRSAAHG